MATHPNDPVRSENVFLFHCILAEAANLIAGFEVVDEADREIKLGNTVLDDGDPADVIDPEGVRWRIKVNGDSVTRHRII